MVLSGDLKVKTGIKAPLNCAKIAYPVSSPATLCSENGELTVCFTAHAQAVFLEICK